MKTITLEQLSVYLPYKLKCKGIGNNVYELLGLQYGNSSVSNELWIFKENKKYMQGYLYECKPLLHPLSKILDFPELIEHILEKREFEKLFIDEWKNHLFINSKGEVCINSHSPNDDYILIGLDFETLYYWELVLLAKYHIDIFNWIGQGLAEPIK